MDTRRMSEGIAKADRWSRVWRAGTNEQTMTMWNKWVLQVQDRSDGRWWE